MLKEIIISASILTSHIWIDNNIIKIQNSIVSNFRTTASKKCVDSYICTLPIKFKDDKDVILVAKILDQLVNNELYKNDISERIVKIYIERFIKIMNDSKNLKTRSDLIELWEDMKNFKKLLNKS